MTTVQVRLGKTEHVALVDAADLPLLADWRLYYWKRPNRRAAYVICQHKTEKARGRPKQTYLHRLIMGVTDHKVGIDHEDGDGLNCTRLNLREATGSQNNMNRRPSARKMALGLFKGVSWSSRRGRWVANIRHEGPKHLGYFEFAVDAAMAYDAAARKFFGRFALTNEDMGHLPIWIEEAPA